MGSNTSQGAKFDPSTVDLDCPECGAKLILKPSRYGPFWGCERWRETRCNGSVGAHPDGRPLGTPVTQDVKLLRIELHNLFDQLWQGQKMRRWDAYNWLVQKMKMTRGEAHIGLFGREECLRASELVRARLEKMKV